MPPLQLSLPSPDTEDSSDPSSSAAAAAPASGAPATAPSFSCVTEALLNMNEAGDDHVSFSAKQLALSPCGSYLLVGDRGVWVWVWGWG